MRIKDFDQYYETFFRDQYEAGTIQMMPESLNWPVTEYKDTPKCLTSTDSHSILLHVPELFWRQFFDSVTKEQRYLEKLLYECLPTFQTYT